MFYKLIFTFIFFSIFDTIKAQPINDFCKRTADSLISTGVKYVVYYQPFVSPLTHEANDTCVIYERRYIFWEDNNGSYVLTHFDYFNIDNKLNGKYALVCRFIDSIQIFGFLKDNLNPIVTDKLLPAVLKYTKDGKPFVDDFSKIKMSDASYTQVYVFVGGNIFNNGYADHEVYDGVIRNSDGTFRERLESINYAANIQKAIFKFINKLDKQVGLLDVKFKDKSFGAPTTIVLQ